jgi:SAM-dependent methyltransferase
MSDVRAGAPGMNESATVGRFTDPAWWDAYWEGLELPTEVKKADSLLIGELTGIFDRYVPPREGMRVLEIGGSSGRYLVYLHRRLGCSAHVLESSPVGAEAARRNFELLGIPGDVTLGDMFDESVELEPMDVVYSLGLIEHFDDPAAVARAHLRFLKPGGLLIIGVPNLAGINRVLFNRLSPSIFDTHDAASADIDSWTAFERLCGLTTIFKGYIGGFEPTMFWRVEGDRKTDVALALALKQLGRITNASWTRSLRGFNDPRWSAYAIAVYQAPGSS